MQVTTRTDAYDQVITKEQLFDGDLLEVTWKYDALGRMVELRDPLGLTWQWAFDSLGRNFEESGPNSGTTTATYDDAGRLRQTTDAKGQMSDLVYDLGGRPSTRRTYDGSGTMTGTVTYGYSQSRAQQFNQGRLTQVTGPGPGNGRAFGYDAAGRLNWEMSSLEGVDYLARRTFDAGGRALTIQYPDNETIGPLTYDETGRLKTIPGFVSLVSYDAVGRAVNRVNQNGTVTSRTFDPERGSLSTLTTTNGGTAPLQAFEYSYRDSGRLNTVSSSTSPESWSYGYDSLYRLVAAENQSDPAMSQQWNYDAGGRMTFNSRVGTYQYPPVSSGAAPKQAPSHIGAAAITYDPNGNMVAGAGRTISWNVDNLPSQVNGTVYTYDAGGGRTKVFNTGAGGTTKLYPFGDDYEISNGVVTKYISAPGLGIVAKRSASTLCPPAGTCWIHENGTGSVQVVTDGFGTKLNNRTYGPYGMQLHSKGSHAEARGWIGQRHDEATGLTYLHARYYDPALGLFLSRDPLGPGGGLNEFGYGGGDPVNYSDPSGLDPIPALCFEIGGSGYGCAGSPGGGSGGPGSGRPRSGPARPGLSLSQNVDEGWRVKIDLGIFTIEFDQAGLTSTARDVWNFFFGGMPPTNRRSWDPSTTRVTDSNLDSHPRTAMPVPQPVPPTGGGSGGGWQPPPPPVVVQIPSSAVLVGDGPWIIVQNGGFEDVLGNMETGERRRLEVMMGTPFMGGAGLLGKVHGNALASGRTTWLYRLWEANAGGEPTAFLKWGVTSIPARRYTQQFLTGKAFQIEAVGSRRAMIEAERAMVRVNPGPLNRERWAGKRLSELIE